MKNVNRKFESFLRENYSTQTINSYSRVVQKYLDSQPNFIKSSYQDILLYAHKLRMERGHARLGREVCAIKKFYDFLLSEGKIQFHPCWRMKIDSRKKTGKCFSQMLNRLELQSLNKRNERYNYTTHRNRVLLCLLTSLGLMPFEITKLKIEDLNFSTDEPRIRISKSRKLSSRTLKIESDHIPYFRNYLTLRLKMNSISDRLFLSIRGDHYTTDALNALIEAQKYLVPLKTVSCSKIRESVISNWINIDKIDLGVVQYMSGHKWPSTTENYINPNTQVHEVKIQKFHPMELDRKN